MKLLAGDKFTACLVKTRMETCEACGYAGYRILVIRSARGKKSRATLCGEHFAEACGKHPEIRELERFRLDRHSLKSAAMQPNIYCPCCGAQLDLGERGSYKVILATGIVCTHCHARLIVEHNTARPESG